MSILSDYRATVESATGIKLTGAAGAVADKISAAVESFLVEAGIGHRVNHGEFTAMEGMQQFDVSNFGSQVGFDAVDNLISACGIAKEDAHAAGEEVSCIIGRILGSGNRSVWSSQGTRMHNYKGAVRALETYVPSEVAEVLRSEANPVAILEGFGVDVDKVVPDLKVSIAVSLMRFHRALLPNLIPNRGTDSPNVQYTRPTVLLYQLDNNDAAPVPLIEMYKDAALISNKLQDIVPLVSADSSTDPVLVADGIIKNAKAFNLLTLSINQNKYGHTHINYTDLVAEGPRMAKVYIRLNTTGGSTSSSTSDSTAALNIFCITIPTSTGRLSRITDGLDSSIRQTMFQYKALLGSTSTAVNSTYAESAGATVLAGIEATEQLIVDIRVSAELKLKNGEGFANISATASAYDSTGAEPSDAMSAVLADLATGGVEIIGFELEAKFAEENLRKSNIAVRTTFAPFSYDIPVGRNFIYDWPLGVQQEDISTQLSDVISIGMDDRALKLFDACLSSVASEVAAEAAAPIARPAKISDNFVTGSKVNPYVWQGTLDIAKIQSIRTADRPGDIAQYAQTFLTRVVERMLTKSFYNHQLGINTSPKFNLYTSLSVLSNILGMPQIYAHLDKRESDSISKVPYRMILQNGVVIDCFWHTFDMVQDKIVVIPSVEGDATSDLNFGHNWDYGTVVGQFTQTGDAIFNRIYANCRELPIITCPVAAIIDVLGIASVTGAIDAQESAPTPVTTTYVKLV